MEFVESTEVEEVVQNLQIGAEDVNEHVCRLDLAEQADLTRHELKLEPEQAATRLDEILGRLSLDQLLLVPTRNGRHSRCRGLRHGGRRWREFDHRNRAPQRQRPRNMPFADSRPFCRLIEILAHGEGDEQSFKC